MLSKNLPALWSSTVGKKAVMAVSGGLLFLWLLLHIAGNLLVFAGPAVIDGYGAALHARPWLLWLMRIGLLVLLGAHLAAALSLTRLARQARGRAPQARRAPAVFSARTLRWGGLTLLAFVVFHLLQLTFGVAALHPHFVPGAVYHNVVSGLANPVVVLVYFIGLVALALHLDHGLWSLWRSLGVASSSPHPLSRPLARPLAIAVLLAFLVIPVAVVTGLLR